VLEKVPGHKVLSGIETLRAACSFLFSYAAPLRFLNVGVTCNCPVHSAVIPRHLWGVKECVERLEMLNKLSELFAGNKYIL
jgi:hypothetical protein